MAQVHKSSNSLLKASADIRAAGAWGPGDAQGALNYIGPGQVREAAALVSSGRTVGLGLPLDTAVGPDNPRPVMHTMTDSPAAYPAGGTAFACDSFTVECHGDAHSHIDALRHVTFGGSLYNGVDAISVTAAGAGALGAENLRNGIAGRGILPDIAATRQAAWIEPGEVITSQDLLAAEEAQGVRVRAGDIFALPHRTPAKAA